MLSRNPLGQELLVDLLSTSRWQSPAEEGTDLGLPDIELMAQNFGVVSVALKPAGFESHVLVS